MKTHTMKTVLLLTASLIVLCLFSSLCRAVEPLGKSCALVEVGDVVAESLMNHEIEVRGYRQQLAWEALLRLGSVADKNTFRDWVVAEAAKSGLTPKNYANTPRS